MKKLVLTLSLITSALCSQAQLVVEGISPAPIQGMYDFNYASNPAISTSATSVGPWGADLSLVAIQDTLVLVDDGTAADSLGCNALVNDLTGKIAILYRGSCSFYSKALMAKNAGALAVIIINNTTGLINPASNPANDNTLIDIPVVIIRQDDGAAIRAQMEQGPVVMFLGNMSGFYADNLGIYNEYISRARAYATPTITAQAQAEYAVPMGGYIINRGSADVTDAVLTVNVDFNGSSIHTETSGLTSILAGDTAIVNLTDFTQATYPVGKYTVTYTVSMGNTDMHVYDDVLTQEFEIVDDIYSLVPTDDNGLPVATTHTRSGSAGLTAFTTCIKYENSNANRLYAKGMYFSAKNDSATLNQEEFSLVVYQWDDVFDNQAAAYADNFTSLTEVVTKIYYMEGDLQGVMTYVPFDEGVQLYNDTKYLFCVTPTTNPEINLGFNDVIDYSLNNWNLNESIHPMHVEATSLDTWYGGFTSNDVPAIGILTDEIASIGIGENVAIEGLVYPNPANDGVTIAINAEGNAKLHVTDITGKVVMKNDINLLNGNAKVNIGSLESGIYIFNVVLANGTSSQFSVVKK